MHKHAHTYTHTHTILLGGVKYICKAPAAWTHTSTHTHTTLHTHTHTQNYTQYFWEGVKYIYSDPNLTKRVGRLFGEHVSHSGGWRFETRLDAYVGINPRVSGASGASLGALWVYVNRACIGVRPAHTHTVHTFIATEHRTQVEIPNKAFDFVRQGKNRAARPLNGGLPPLPADVAVPFYVSG